MKIKTKHFAAIMLLCGTFPVAHADNITGHMGFTSIIGVAFEILVILTILYFCAKGVKTCFKHDFYKNFIATYHSEKIGYDNFYINENLQFNYESAQRVKQLMESRKKKEFKKNSTINQHLNDTVSEKIFSEK